MAVKESSADGEDIRYKQLLAARMAMTREKLTAFLDTHGVSLTVLETAMEEFTGLLFAPPEEIACRAGCTYCCHLHVGVSIPEALVIYNGLMTRARPEGLAMIRKRVMDTAKKENSPNASPWLENRMPCPFLDDRGCCMIYDLRPFSCRAHHSTDEKICRKNFEKRDTSPIPSFPRYRAFTDMYSSVFIKVLKHKGFASFKVEFIKALEILFTDKGAAEAWLSKEHVFGNAKMK